MSGHPYVLVARSVLICKRRVFLQQVEKKFPGDREKLARMSLIEGTHLVSLPWRA